MWSITNPVLRYSALVIPLLLAAAPRAGSAEDQDWVKPVHPLDRNPVLSRSVKLDLGRIIEFESPDIQVVSDEYSITLYGYVGTAEQIEQAGHIARNISGVSRVVNARKVRR